MTVRDSMRPTVTVWVLHLNRPELFVCGPYLSERDAVTAGGGCLEEMLVKCNGIRGLVRDPLRRYDSDRDTRKFPAGAFPVNAGLVVRLDDIPTTSLREIYSPTGKYWWLPDNFQLQKDPKAGGGPYSDEELDARFPDRAAVEARLPAWKKLTNL